MSHVAAYFLCNEQKDKALEVMRYKETICEIKQVRCPYLTKELWLIHGHKASLSFDTPTSGLDALCVVLSNPSRALWLEYKDRIVASLHPFVFVYVPMFSKDIISSQEQKEFLERGSLHLC